MAHRPKCKHCGRIAYAGAQHCPMHGKPPASFVPAAPMSWWKAKRDARVFAQRKISKDVDAILHNPHSGIKSKADLTVAINRLSSLGLINPSERKALETHVRDLGKWHDPAIPLPKPSRSC